MLKKEFLKFTFPTSLLDPMMRFLASELPGTGLCVKAIPSSPRLQCRKDSYLPPGASGSERGPGGCRGARVLPRLPGTHLTGPLLPRESHFGNVDEWLWAQAFLGYNDWWHTSPVLTELLRRRNTSHSYPEDKRILNCSH